MLDNELMNSATFSPAVKTGALTMLADGNTLHAVSDVFGVPVDVLAAWEQEQIALPDDQPHRVNIRRRRIATANSVNQGGKFIGRSVAIFAAGLSILLFFFSLFLPAFGQWPGIWALSLGWFEMAVLPRVGPFVALAWVANPLILGCWGTLLTGAYRTALMLSATAFILAAGFLFGAVVLVSESGEASPIGPRGAGYALWLASMFIALLGSVCVALAPSENGNPR